MKKVIVTGANGFIGSALIKELIKHDIKVYALIKYNKKDNLPDSNLIEYCNFNLENISAVKEKLQNQNIDTFFHFAWKGSAGIERANTKLQLQNVQWTIECLQLAKDLGCQKFVNAGSIMEIETIEATFKSGNRPGLGYIYGSAKLAAHNMCKAIAADLNIDLVWALITNAYGVGERSERLVNTTIKKCINNEKPQFTSGVQNYDFVYIDDVARALYLIGKKGNGFCEYMIGSSNAKPLKEFLLEMQSEIAPNLEFIFGDIPYTGVNLDLEKFDCSKTEEDTGFKAAISFKEGCRRTKEWLQKEMEEDNESKI